MGALGMTRDHDQRRNRSLGRIDPGGRRGGAGGDAPRRRRIRSWPTLIVLAIGLAAGAINGILVTGLRLVPFIVTLGTMMIFRGAAEQVAHQEQDRGRTTLRSGSATLRRSAGRGEHATHARRPPGWSSLLGIVLAIVLHFTVFGRHVFAIGSNEATARLCGVNVPRTKIIVYALGGLFMALAGLFSFSELNKQGNPDAGLGHGTDIIAAVVIGGGSLSGGRGSVLGSIVGALTMTDPAERLRLRRSRRFDRRRSSSAESSSPQWRSISSRKGATCVDTALARSTALAVRRPASFPRPAARIAAATAVMAAAAGTAAAIGAAATLWRSGARLHIAGDDQTDHLFPGRNVARACFPSRGSSSSSSS